jgi:hypothetical protein
MPIRIKPKIDLGPCVLTLKCIEGITELVIKEFPDATFSANDYIWEIFDENRAVFIKEISEREKLDEFIVSVKTPALTSTPKKDLIEEIKIVFNKDEATVTCDAHPSQQNWIEHFLLDLNKHILPPSFSQRVANLYRKGELSVSLPVVFGSLLAISLDGATDSTKNPYSHIVIKESPPSPFVENIKANLVSSVIWALIGALLLLIGQWVWRTYGIDINPFD